LFLPMIHCLASCVLWPFIL